MSIRKISLAACLVISVLCLIAGYGIARQWMGVIFAIITGCAWLLAPRYPGFWLPLICLLASVCLAATGCLVGCPSLLMILGSGTALAVWDILSLDASLKSNPFGEQTRRYENSHLQSLALAIVPALVIVSLGHLIHIQVPFLILVFLVVTVVFGLDRVWRYFGKHHLHS